MKIVSDFIKIIAGNIKELRKILEKAKVKYGPIPFSKLTPQQIEEIAKEIDESNEIARKELSITAKRNPQLKGFVTDIEKDTINNNNFRKVLYTGKHSQLVLMSINPGDDIGEEIHNVDQFFRIDSGSGKVIINGKEHKIFDGSAFIVPAGAKHNVVNDEKKSLKLYSIYSPPHHKDKIIHKTKEKAMKDKEHFDKKTTE
jgi:mannose-6-phosphate isomerase-like protein (cupin superfamily)